MSTVDPASLQNLHDIIVPVSVSWLPPAPGWYALTGTLCVAGSWLLLHKYLQWKRNSYRREALALLQKLRVELEHPQRYGEQLPKLPQLLKRTAIAAYGRERVAHLSGDEWLAFLDTSSGSDRFTAGSGRFVFDCAYESGDSLSQLTYDQVNGTVEAVTFWFNSHTTLPGDSDAQL